MIIGTAGHIDHGKTTLLKALTNIDTDRLAEEKRRGISIDLGFAHAELGPYRVGFVDVPGHERFVRNMLAGVGGIHLVMLVVASDESVMPQTVEHFQICRLLEIPRGVIVLTKKNLVEEELLSLVQMEVRELVRGSFLEEAPVVAVDSVSGEGLEELRQVLIQELTALHQSMSGDEKERIFRMPVDRVFTIHGFGTVVTGTPYAGSLKRGASVQVHPTGAVAKVRGVEVFNQPRPEAVSGQRTALNLSGLEKEELSRGVVISASGFFHASSVVDALVQHLGESPAPIKQRAAIRFHHGSSELIARIQWLEGQTLEPGQEGLAQIRLEKPTLCCPGDHFILRRYSPLATIGGGVILDGHAVRHRHKDLETLLPALRTLAEAWGKKDGSFESALLEYQVWLRGPQGIDSHSLAGRTGLHPARIEKMARGLQAVVVVSQTPFQVAHAAHLERLEAEIVDHLARFHREHPLASGISREELKERFLAQSSGNYFQRLLDRLAARGQLTSTGALVSLAGHRVELDPRQAEIRREILDHMQRAGLQPPRLEELVASLSFEAAQVRNVFYFLLESGELVRISEEIVLTREQWGEVEERLRGALPRGESFSVSDFKDLFSISRKYAIPFLEYLDRQKITQRRGDSRVLL